MISCNEAPRSKLRGITELNFEYFSKAEANPAASCGECSSSNYTQWFNVEGAPGLIRQNSKLRGSKGIREEDEKKLLPESFNTDFERLDGALQRLEAFRLKAIDWRYPNEAV